MTQSPLWLATEIAAATDGQLRGDFCVTGIENNTRLLQSGDLYVALAGLGKHDGHDFVATAFEQGASGALVSRDLANNTILVDDTLTALRRLGQAARDRIAPETKLIAITGSVGKTTTRALTAHAFSVFGKLHASEHSLNNHWGVPLSLARMPKDTQYGVFEVGMNHAGEITELTTQIRPHVAIITNVEAVHLEFFPDGIPGIARAKAEVFVGVEPGGTIVLNRDNSQFDLLVAEATRYGIDNIVTFGRHANADLRLLGYERLEHGGRVIASLHGTEFSFLLPMRSEHNALNALATLGAVHALGLDVSFAAAAFALIEDVAGRGNVSTLTLPQIGTITLIDDRHNSSPVALTSAITEFAQMNVAGRRVLALGDMRELGETSPQLHAAMAPIILNNKIDLVLTCGPMMAHLAQVLPKTLVKYYPDSPAMADDLVHHLRSNDALLVKGSRFANMIVIVDALNRLSQT